MKTVVVSSPRRREQLPQHPEGCRGNTASALPSRFNIVFRAPEEEPPLTISPMSPYDTMRSNLQALSLRIAARSASLRLGVPRTCSTAVLVHG